MSEINSAQAGFDQVWLCHTLNRARHLHIVFALAAARAKLETLVGHAQPSPWAISMFERFR